MQLLVYAVGALALCMLALWRHGRLSYPHSLSILGYLCGVPNYFKLSGVPPPKPLSHFDIDKAKPRPYRPFRWEYHQTMGMHSFTRPHARHSFLPPFLALKKMEPDWWIELESTYRERLAQRKALYAEHGKKVLNYLPGSERACTELMHMVIQFICARYPNQFQFDPFSGRFVNKILDVEVNTKEIAPLVFLLEHVPEDFLLTAEDEKTGLYHMRAGIACSAVGWNVDEKIGKPMHEIHRVVPDYDKMKLSIDRSFCLFHP